VTLAAADFDFFLAPEHIAQHPAVPRDAARLLVVGETLADRIVRDLPDLLRPGDLLVVNDTRVIPAQLEALRGAARVGITLDRPLADGTWHALARNARRLHVGDKLRFSGADDFTAAIESVNEGGSVALRFSHDGTDFQDRLSAVGALALPPYIARPQGPTSQDMTDYQTMFARREGAVAAPTAGLHFTTALLEALTARGVRRVDVTLHVGAGTFLPLRDDDISKHKIHAERGEIAAEAASAINTARQKGGRIVAVGTTSLRLLESATDEAGSVQAFSGETDIFITPGRTIRGAEMLLTNFHLPRSTLFMLVCAFAGIERMRTAYAHAIEAGYRFYSYGDASLLSRA
jgi:S-adenosylmethionine:tRNA ribosyltransferase-isomerase